MRCRSGGSEFHLDFAFSYSAILVLVKKKWVKNVDNFVIYLAN